MLFCVFFTLSFFTVGQATMIRSDRVSNFGEWGPFAQCPPNSYVKAISVKEDIPVNGVSAINAVKLSCVALDQQVSNDRFPVLKVITSTEGYAGHYLGGPYVCYGGVAIGFQEMSEDEHDNGNDFHTGNNEVILIYLNSTGEYQTPHLNGRWGEWRSAKRCPPRTAVCGLQTQVESDPRTGPNLSGLNNVDLFCCNLPNPAETCHPQDDWLEIITLDNTKSGSFNIYTVRKKIGVNKALLRGIKSSSVMEEIAGNIGFEVNSIVLTALEDNFVMNLSTSPNTLHMWSQSGKSVFSLEQTETMEIKVPAGCTTILQQVVGKCGPYVIHSDALRPVVRC